MERTRGGVDPDWRIRTTGCGLEPVRVTRRRRKTCHGFVARVIEREYKGPIDWSCLRRGVGVRPQAPARRVDCPPSSHDLLSRKNSPTTTTIKLTALTSSRGPKTNSSIIALARTVSPQPPGPWNGDVHRTRAWRRRRFCKGRHELAVSGRRQGAGGGGRGRRWSATEGKSRRSHLREPL